MGRSVKKRLHDGVKDLEERLQSEYDYSQEPVEQNWGAEIYPGRANWGSHMDFLMASMAFSFGLSNFTVFPFQSFKYGNILYLVPYLICVIFISLPMMMVEMAIGQYTGHGLLTCWEMAPIMGGIGVGMLLVALPTAVYFNMIIGWCLLYLYESVINIAGNPPFQSCENSFNTPYCSELWKNTNRSHCEAMNMTISDDGVCYSCTYPDLNQTLNGNATCMDGTLKPYGIWNDTITGDIIDEFDTPGSEYMTYFVLGLTDDASFTHLGAFRWQSFIMLAASWLALYIGLFFGVKTTGKIAYYVVTFPVLVFVGMLVYLCTVDGSIDGLKYYVTEIDWSLLYSAAAWESAANAAVFSGGAVGGTQMVLCSYNSFHNNVLRDAIILTISEFFLSVLASLLVYASAGILAYSDSNTSIADQLNEEQLAFETFPRALSIIPYSGVLLMIYFLSLVTLSYSQFFYIEALSTSILDVFPKLHKPKYRRPILALMCLGLTALGIPMCFEGGVYVYHLLSVYSTGGNLLILGVLQSLGISWIYGVKNFQQDVGLMMGNQKVFGMTWKRYSKYFMICWAVISPFLALVVTVVSFAGVTRLEYGEYEFPSWTFSLGYAFAVFNVGGGLMYCLYLVYSTKGTLKEKITKNFTCDELWGPALTKHRVKVAHLHKFNIDPHWQGTDKVDFNYSYKPYFMARRMPESYA